MMYVTVDVTAPYMRVYVTKNQYLEFHWRNKRKFCLQDKTDVENLDTYYFIQNVPLASRNQWTNQMTAYAWQTIAAARTLKPVGYFLYSTTAFQYVQTLRKLLLA
jgi:hypothetical protein